MRCQAFTVNERNDDRSLSELCCKDCCNHWKDESNWCDYLSRVVPLVRATQCKYFKRI